MRHLLPKAFIPAMAAAIVLTATATSHAQWFGWYWDSYWPSYYSSYYTPSYSTYYSPSYYTSSYVPTYTTSYTPTVTYYAGSSACCSPCTACASCNTCCSPCTSCASCNTCCSPCTACGSCDCTGDCALSSNSQSNNPTSAQPRSNSSTPTRNRTFIDENDRGTGNQQYESPSQGTGDGFSPRDSNDSGPDPLDSSFGTSSASRRDQLRFKVPSADFQRNETAPEELDFKNPTRRVKSESSDRPSFPLLKLDEKITSRPMPQRTRLVERRSWQEPVIARNEADSELSEINLGWVPMPAPAQLVQK